MPKPTETKHSPMETGDVDPSIYASSLSGLMMDRNPLQNIWTDLTRMVMTIVTLGKTRKLAQQRLEQLNQKIIQIEQDMTSVNPPQEGTRFNKLR